MYCFNEKIITFSCSDHYVSFISTTSWLCPILPRQSKLTYIISADSLPFSNPPSLFWFTVISPWKEIWWWNKSG
jgi:hypothetical protein